MCVTIVNVQNRQKLLFSTFKGYRIDIIRLVGVVFLILLFVASIFLFGASLGSKSGYYSAQSEGYASQFPSDTDIKIEQCFDEADKSALKKCAQEAIASGRESQREEYELQAQKETAEWSYYALLISFIQIPINIIGLVALIITIKQGQSALRRAREANNIAREIGDAQVRPYLHLKGDLQYTVDKSLLIYEIDTFIENSGQIPAVNIRVTSDCYLGHPDTGHSMGGYRLRQERNFHFIGNGDKQPISFPVPFTLNEWQKISERKVAMLCRVTASYTDSTKSQRQDIMDFICDNFTIRESKFMPYFGFFDCRDNKS